MKNWLKVYLCTILTMFCVPGVVAVSIVECEDPQGERSFHKKCPPGTIKVSVKKVSLGKSSDSKNGIANIKAVLYSVPNCDTCDEVKEFLQARNISFEEKDVGQDVDLQKELSDLVGALKVPTVVLGGEPITGYNRTKMLSVLEKLSGDGKDNNKDKKKSTKG